MRGPMNLVAMVFAAYLSALFWVASDDKAADKRCTGRHERRDPCNKCVAKNSFDQRQRLSNSYSRASRPRHEARNPLLQNSQAKFLWSWLHTQSLVPTISFVDVVGEPGVVLTQEQLDKLVIQAFAGRRVTKKQLKSWKISLRKSQSALIYDVLWYCRLSTLLLQVEGGLQRAGVFFVKESALQAHLVINCP